MLVTAVAFSVSKCYLLRYYERVVFFKHYDYPYEVGYTRVVEYNRTLPNYIYPAHNVYRQVTVVISGQSSPPIL